ncbi:MAG: hypothetical protein FRX49_11547 [Trebouxia sp. A1-2]|nr:MAG: hypothetical protein FRX49_11547 [Trebouxia sp. A1-2]
MAGLSRPTDWAEAAIWLLCAQMEQILITRLLIQHLAQHALSVGRRTDALEQGWVGFKREWGVPQQHAHHLTLTHATSIVKEASIEVESAVGGSDLRGGIAQATGPGCARGQHSFVQQGPEQRCSRMLDRKIWWELALSDQAGTVASAREGACEASGVPSLGWAASVRITCSQFWPEVVRMGVAVRRCMIWFRSHNDLLWGFHILRSGPSSRVQVVISNRQGLTCNKGHPQHHRHSNGCSMPTAVVPSTAGGSTAWSHR